MPIESDTSIVPGTLVSVFTGRVTDAEFLDYYERLIEDPPLFPWLEIVDGRAIEHMGISPWGEGRLAGILGSHMELLRDARVAMVAEAGSAAYGMFRMWEIRREHLNYRVEVFTDFGEARAWILRAQGLVS